MTDDQRDLLDFSPEAIGAYILESLQALNEIDPIVYLRTAALITRSLETELAHFSKNTRT
jgi:hypothetical protein